MNTIEFQSAAWPGSTDVSGLRLVLAKIGRVFRAILRTTILAGLYPFAVGDAAWQWLVTTPTGSALAHSRAAWLHRWSRIARRVLGLRLNQRGFTPVSGIVVANDSSLLDAILLAAARPCVFVAGAEVRRWPIVGVLARLGGTLFVDRRQWNDTARINFMIQRAVQRRLLVVIFPECGSSDGAPTPRGFASALFQPAAELGCTLTAAAIGYRCERVDDRRTPAFAPNARFLTQVAHLLTRCRARAVLAFGGPTFHHGDRKHLARQLHGEVRALKFLAAQPAR
jgi:1-acyl-sn-glycerol-3-phosphate acyltransferase